MLRVGTERYIIPTLSVVTSIRPDKENLSTVVNQGEMLILQGELIPLFRLDRLFNIRDAEQDVTKALAIVVEDGQSKVGIMVDELLGQQQIVIKSLGGFTKNIQGIAGGAIMPDGQVGLILDIGELIKLAHS